MDWKDEQSINKELQDIINNWNDINMISKQHTFTVGYYTYRVLKLGCKFTFIQYYQLYKPR